MTPAQDAPSKLIAAIIYFGVMVATFFAFGLLFGCQPVPELVTPLKIAPAHNSYGKYMDFVKADHE